MPTYARSRTTAALAALFVSVGVSISTSITAAAEPEFQSLFDGRSLSEWLPGNPAYWEVKDGAIVGRITKERPCTTNQYLVWRGGELADFELKLEARLNGEGGINGGFQFRSRLLPDHDVCGYQMDNNLRTEWLVRLYDEYGRHDLALRGERAWFDVNGVRTAQPLESARGPAHFRLEDWHEYHLTCLGPKITLRVNGELVAEVEDNDPRRAEPQGVLALQLHSGPPTVAEFRNIRLKILKPANTNTVADWRTREARRKLFDGALAWWLLDAGGHGAQTTLRLVPEFYQFELNVRPAGTGAAPDAKVTVLDGAYFDAGQELQAPADQLTVYLRLRDPAGRWNSALVGKRARPDHAYFNLFSTDLPGTPGPDIAFEIRTTQGFAQASFPVSNIDARAWHNLVGRYDGRTLAIFCDGRLMASQPITGSLIPNSEPLLIGAETQDGKKVRHFRGEVDEAAIWPRALTNTEIAALAAPGQ
ncbi:MAG TPA: DUF1080 domain-containing protein [Verrucomicrobiota bacterium]|nr:DUF1080 domain-containing protein [Verrucomicrobiota bacterium]